MAKKNIVVVGDECIDVFNYGSANRISPETPCPVLDFKKTMKVPGMAGNVARNLENLGLTVKKITNPKKPLKIRYIDQENNYAFLRMDIGTSIHPFQDDPYIQEITKKIEEDVKEADALCIIDYGKGFLNEETMNWLSGLHQKVFIDTKVNDLSWCPSHVVVKINEKEWKGLLRNDFRCKVIVTKGKDGATFDGHHYPIEEVKVYDRMGAGDTFMAGLVWASIVLNVDLPSAIWWANKAASIVAQKQGTAVIYESELI